MPGQAWHDKQNFALSSYYSVRVYVDGYTKSGEFTLKLIKYGNSGIIASIAGYGFSQRDNYYLFKVTTANVTDRYYCFESKTTTKTELYGKLCQ
jgi:hypothetical protein